MPQQTPVISFSLADIGRRHTGKKRNWNIPRLVDAINSPSTQERIRNRDMLGYYGHWPRQRLGMDLAEGGVIDGKVVIIEPAHVTTMMRADTDGTVHHQAEFFDNAPGRAASGLFANKAGGFSSAINHDKPMVYGFDYVLEPNFTANRPYTLDNAAEDDPVTFDEVNEYLGSVKSVAGVIATFDSAREAMQAEIARLNDRLKEAIDAAAGRKATLDSMRSRKTKFDDADRLVEQAGSGTQARRSAQPAPMAQQTEYMALVRGTFG